MNQYIRTENDLETLCSHLQKAPCIAIDTEFIRNNFYYPRLGIIQVASEDSCAIIDPLDIKDLKIFLNLLTNPDITKIFHAAKEDIAVIYSNFQIIPLPVFDTQVASSLVGYEEYISYGKLVNHITGVSLNKKETYTDWLKRPLTKKQIKYALNDVRYLIDIYEKLREDLKRLGRVTWAKEEFKRIEREKNYKEKDIETQYNKIIHHNGLNYKSLNVFIELLKWREKKARDLDKTKKHIIKDDVLLSIAKICPVTEKDLELVPGFFPKNFSRYGREILDVVKKNRFRKKSFERNEKFYKIPAGLVSLLTSYIKTRAEEENIAYGIIATREEIEKFITKFLYDEKCNTILMTGWRRKFIGEDLKKILAGEAQLGFSRENTKITILSPEELKNASPDG